MSPSWFYLAENQRIGPLSFQELHAAGSAGLVRHDTLVCEGDAGDWQPACRVPGLLSVPPLPPPPLPAQPLGVNGPPLPPPVRGRVTPPPPPAARPGIGKLAFRLGGVAAVSCVLAVVGILAAWAVWPAGQTRDGQTAADIAAEPVAGEAVGEPIVPHKIGVISAEAELARRVRGDDAVAKLAPPDATGRQKPKAETPVAKAATRPEVKGPEIQRPEVKRLVQNPFESSVDRAPAGKIDELVFGKLKQLGIQPAGLCSDGVFVRRVYLDVIGTLPTAQEAKVFLQDPDPKKRSVLVDRLLARDEFADYWALKWSDLLRVKAEFPINLWPYASQAYHRWIRTRLQENMPYDRFVRELLTAGGSNFRVPQVNFYRALQSKRPAAIAQAVALTFMGVRADKWPAERLAGMAAFFSKIQYKSTAEWKEEIVQFDPYSGSKSTPVIAPLAAVFPDGTAVKIAADQDPREAFADWLLDAKNPWFARCIVNRIWCWLRGRGIVHEPDDVRPDNPPQNPELLDWLAAELAVARCDLKHVYRLILNSKAYQLAAIPHSDVLKSEANFGHYMVRRLEGETLIDALCQITETTEKYSSLIPEPFTFIPEDMRTIALPDGSITSPFLEMFGRPPRDTGMESERNNRVTAGQRLHLLNSTHIRQKIEQCGKFQALARSDRPVGDVACELYVTILSRLPTDEEAGIVQTYCQSKRKSGVMDVAWALINSEEFLHRH